MSARDKVEALIRMRGDRQPRVGKIADLMEELRPSDDDSGNRQRWMHRWNKLDEIPAIWRKRLAELYDVPVSLLSTPNSVEGFIQALAGLDTGSLPGSWDSFTGIATPLEAFGTLRADDRPVDTDGIVRDRPVFLSPRIGKAREAVPAVAEILAEAPMRLDIRSPRRGAIARWMNWSALFVHSEAGVLMHLNPISEERVEMLRLTRNGDLTYPRPGDPALFAGPAADAVQMIYCLLVAPGLEWPASLREGLSRHRSGELMRNALNGAALQLVPNARSEPPRFEIRALTYRVRPAPKESPAQAS